MGAVSTILAGFVVIGGAVAIYRFAHRKAGEVRDAIDEIRRAAGSDGSSILDYERDPATGVFRPKP